MWILEVAGQDEVLITSEQLTEFMLNTDNYENVYIRPKDCFPWVNLAEYYTQV
jgi:hypothetical protein